MDINSLTKELDNLKSNSIINLTSVILFIVYCIIGKSFTIFLYDYLYSSSGID